MAMDRADRLNRRAILAGLGAAAAGASPTLARAASPDDQRKLTVIDFHNHHVDPAHTLTTMAALPPAARAPWEAINRNLADTSALLASIEETGISARVVNTPTAFIADADGNVPPGTIETINDGLARLVAAHPGRVFALATVDAFSGEAGARELTRAVRDLGLSGAFVESAKGDLLLDAPQARPTLVTAAMLGVPVFVHPVNDKAFSRRFGRYRRLGTMFARGTINSAALVALLEGGVFDEVPNLHIVVTTLALGGVLLAGGFGDGAGIRADTPAASRRHVYVDTMGLNPAAIRASVDLLGADHVLVGTDWPIIREALIHDRLREAFTAAGLSPADQELVASGNVARLLKLAA